MSTTIKPLPAALQAHELAELMPDMQEGELKLLTESIQKSGQRLPIILLDGKILDGRSRYAACLTLGIQPEVRNYDPEKDGTSPTLFVLEHNVNRRHLSVGQRAIIIQNSLPFLEAEAEERKKAAQFRVVDGGQPAPAAPGTPGRSVEKAAKVANVGKTSVQEAAKLTDQHPDLAEKVKAGEMSLHEASTVAKTRTEEPPATSERDDIAKENFEDLRKVHGEDFAISVRDGVNLKSQDELEAFVSLSVEEQRSIKELVARKKKVTDALKWINKEVDRDDRIGDLFLRTLAAGGKKGTWVIDGWNVTVARATTKA